MIKSLNSMSTIGSHQMCFRSLSTKFATRFTKMCIVHTSNFAHLGIHKTH